MKECLVKTKQELKEAVAEETDIIYIDPALEKDLKSLIRAMKLGAAKIAALAALHMPPQKCNLTADDGASPPPEWCTPSAKMVHGGRERGAPDRHAGDHSGMPLRFRMDSPSIWMV